MLCSHVSTPIEHRQAASAIELAATLLWQRFLHFDAADPGWPDRDRCVLSSNRFRPLLDRLLTAAGVAAEGGGWGQHPAQEAAPGPPGQGFAVAVGLAVAERMLAGRFGRTLVDHRTWVLACETDLAAGVALEAAALAGRMELGKLVVLFEPRRCDEAGTIDDGDAATRFAACGWAVRSLDAADPEAVAAAIARAQRNRRPTLIACRNGSAGLAHDPSGWSGTAQRGAQARRAWLRRLARHRLAAEFQRQHAGRLPSGWHRLLLQADAAPVGRCTTMASGRQDLAALCGLLPEAVMLHSAAGQALAPPLELAAASNRSVACGVQEHGMAALANGVSLHGGSRPILSAALISIDRMRPALRLAAAMARPVVYLLADDRGDPAGPRTGWPPVEQLASLRAMPRVALFRPADPDELAACWKLALEREAGPSLMVLDGGLAPPRPGPDPSWRHECCAQGGYVLAEAAGGHSSRRATLIATGPEVATALAARRMLLDVGIETAVVSMPCWELFAGRPASYHAQVLGTAPRVGIEAASGFGWERWLGDGGLFIGMDDFGPDLHSVARPDAPPPGIITADRISKRVRHLLGAWAHPISV